MSIDVSKMPKIGFGLMRLPENINANLILRIYQEVLL